MAVSIPSPTLSLVIRPDVRAFVASIASALLDLEVNGTRCAAHSGGERRGQADQVGAHPPEPCRGGLVVAALGRSPGSAVGEEAACHLLQLRSGSQVDRRGGTLG